VLYVDSLRLKQIYMNLLSNAMKYTPEGGKVTLEIFEAPASDPGKIKLISIISDTGIGMSPEFIPKMYQKFEREVDTRVNQTRGSGLGLPIVKHLVDLMNGTINVQTAPGKGTTFRIELELPYIEKTSVDTHTEKDLSDISCAGMHLLIAEDNDLTANAFTKDIKQYLVSGINDHLSKPLDIHQLMATLTKYKK